MQNNIHWIPTFRRPRRVNRSRSKVDLMLANTGSTVPMRRL